MQPMIVVCFNHRPAIRRGHNEGERSGQTGLKQLQLSLTWQTFALAASLALQCSALHRRGHSNAQSTTDLKLIFASARSNN